MRRYLLPGNVAVIVRRWRCGVPNCNSACSGGGGAAKFGGSFSGTFSGIFLGTFSLGNRVIFIGIIGPNGVFRAAVAPVPKSTRPVSVGDVAAFLLLAVDVELVKSTIKNDFGGCFAQGRMDCGENFLFL